MNKNDFKKYLTDVNEELHTRNQKEVIKYGIFYNHQCTAV
jgi:hypothetical protein